MKIILMLVLSGLAMQGIAQPTLAEHRKQLAPLQVFVGKWHGVATIQQPGGTLTLNQEENIHWELDSLLLRIEGIGKDPVTNKMSFHALAFVSYNAITQQLTMRSYTHEGRQADAYFRISASNKFEWGFDIPANRGKVRYTITFIDGKKWHEIGEFSSDGTQWVPFITMDLTKKTE